MTSAREKQLEEATLGPLTHTSRAWYLWLLFLVVVTGSGIAAYGYQMQNGLAVTAMRDAFPAPALIAVAGSSAGGYGTFTGYGELATSIATAAGSA